MKIKKMIALLCCVVLLTGCLSGCCCITPSMLAGLFEKEPDAELADYLKDHGEQDGNLYYLRDSSYSGSSYGSYFVVYNDATEQLSFEYYSSDVSSIYSPAYAEYTANSYLIIPVNYGEETTRVTYVSDLSTSTYTVTGTMYKDSFSTSDYTLYDKTADGPYDTVKDIVKLTAEITSATTLMKADQILSGTTCEVTLFDLGFEQF